MIIVTSRSTILKALPGELDIDFKRRSPSILYISVSLAIQHLPGELYIKRHSPSILYITDLRAAAIAVAGKVDVENPIFTKDKNIETTR